MKELILLDSAYTDTVFYNSKYVSNIRYSDIPLNIIKNGGLMKLHQKCDISYINNLWYNKNSITNITSMKYMTEKICIVMDSKEELALLVHMPNRIIKFKEISNGLYAMDLNNKESFIITNKQYQFMNMLENLKFLSPRQ